MLFDALYRYGDQDAIDQIQAALEPDDVRVTDADAWADCSVGILRRIKVVAAELHGSDKAKNSVLGRQRYTLMTAVCILQRMNKLMC